MEEGGPKSGVQDTWTIVDPTSVVGTAYRVAFTRRTVVLVLKFRCEGDVPMLLEDNRFVFVEENSVFNVPTNSAGEDHFFKVPSFFH
jgi:hypothetical protein